MKVIIKNARLSFPSIFQFATYQGQSRDRYEASFLLPKDSDAVKDVQNAIQKVGSETLGANWKKAKNPLSDGDGREYDGYEGMWAIKASTKKRPAVLDYDKTTLVEEDGRIYAGCYVNASLSIYAFSNNYGNFIAAQLNGIQFFAPGKPFAVDEGDPLDDFEVFEPSSVEVAEDNIPW